MLKDTDKDRDKGRDRDLERQQQFEKMRVRNLRLGVMAGVLAFICFMLAAYYSAAGTC